MSRFIHLTALVVTPTGIVEKSVAIVAASIALLERTTLSPEQGGQRLIGATVIQGAHNSLQYIIHARETPDVIESMIQQSLPDLPQATFFFTKEQQKP